MLLQFFFPAGLTALVSSGVGQVLSIVLLACLLGALVAGILILISKLRHAQAGGDGESSSQYHHGAAFVMLGAVSTGAYTALSILSLLVALCAVIFVVLLIVVRIKGYVFVSPRDVAELAKPKEKPEDAYAPVQEPLVNAEEEQRQEAYTPALEEITREDSVIESEPLDIFAQNEPDVQAQAVEETAVAELLPAASTRMISEPSATSAGEGNAQSGPYKIVEKIVTETQKEIVREVPASGTKTDTATEQLLEKLTDFLDYELQKRKEADQETAEERRDDSVATFAKNVADPENEELDDEDEIEEDDDLEDGEEAKDEEDDVDNEEPDGEDRFTGNERIIGFDEATGCYIVAHYRKSFEAKLIQARPRIKQYYSELKNALLSYKGTKSRISWTVDSFHNGRTQIAKINVKTNILELYLALEPETLEGTVYRGKNVGAKKKYADTPFLYKLRTPRKFKWAMELVQRTCEEHGLSPIDIEKIDYEPLYPFESTESLVARKLIKEYIREEKPATTFELDPDHVPVVPEEDESVIPVNANFSWEFDNDLMDQKEEPEEAPVFDEPAPEVAPEVEPEVEPEVAPTHEEAPTPAAEIVRETVKITEMRYTERYYANGQVAYDEQTVTTEEPSEETVEEILELPETAFVQETLEEESIEEEIAEEEELSEESYDEPVDESELTFEAEETEESEENEEYFFEESSAENEERYSEEDDFSEEYVEEEYPVEEAYAEEEYAQEDYAQEEYTEEAYSEEEYTQEEYTQEEYTQEEYTQEEYTQEEYTQEEYFEEEYVEEEIEEESFAQVDPSVAVIDICSVADSFEDGDTVNLQTLKEKGLIVSSASTLKIYATGTLDKCLSVEANHFTLDAIFAISGADGDTSMLY